MVAYRSRGSEGPFRDVNNRGRVMMIFGGFSVWSPKDRNIKKQVDAEFRQTWDKALEMGGRSGEARLTDGERTQLMGIVVRSAILWGVVAGAIGILNFIAYGLFYGDWTNWAVQLLLGPIVAVGRFLWKRRQLLDRSAAMWREKREQLVNEEVTRRSDPMTPDEERLVQEYGAILATVGSRMVVDVGELPAAKEKIRVAILKALRIEPDQKTRDHLKTGFLFLSAFQEGAKGIGDGIVNENMSAGQIVNAIPPKALIDKVLEEQDRLADDLKRSGL